MKTVMMTMCALAATCALAKPLRHPVYEPDGREAVGDAAPGQKNLFLNAKVSATGQFGKYAPSFAVNGKHSSSFEYWAAENLPQSLTVDMGEVKPLSSIRLYPYWDDGRVYGFKVEGSADGKNWKLLDDKTANSICTGAADFTIAFDTAEVRCARFICATASRRTKRSAFSAGTSRS